MDFAFTDEQVQLRASIRAYLASRNNFAARTAAIRAEPGWREDVWRDLADRLGILGVAIPAAAGGLDGTAIDTMVIMEEFGESLLPEPFFETAVIAAGLLKAAGDREGELAAIAAGQARYAVGWLENAGRYRYNHVETLAERDGDSWRLNGEKSMVSAAPWATHLLVTARTGGATRDIDGISLFLVEPAREGVTLQSYPTIDGRRGADIGFADVELPAAALVGAAGNALPWVEKVSDTAIAALGAEAVGVMRRMVQDTIDYTKQRQQFGQSIAGFQALQHRMVDMTIQLELATSAVYRATLSLNDDPQTRAMATSAAKVTVGNACRYVGQNAVQLHGGMGMTDELAISHYFKRATVIESEFGTVDYHLDRYVELSAAA